MIITPSKPVLGEVCRATWRVRVTPLGLQGTLRCGESIRGIVERLLKPRPCCLVALLANNWGRSARRILAFRLQKRLVAGLPGSIPCLSSASCWPLIQADLAVWC